MSFKFGLGAMALKCYIIDPPQTILDHINVGLATQQLNLNIDELLASQHTRELKFFHPYEEVFRFCNEAVESLGEYKIKEANFEQGRITAQRMHWPWKKIISFELQKQSDTITIANVTTKSIFIGWLEPLDKGVSLRCMLKLQQLLSPYLAEE